MLEQLKAKTEAGWKRILDNSRFVRHIQEGKLDRKLYALYLVETYHYTKHNSRNQALVGVKMGDGNPQYQKFCFDHAMEETGHELMAWHDAKALGLSAQLTDLPAPLPATEVLIAYLYWISEHGNPLRRLGYSFWAENSYEYINPLVDKIRTTLDLKNSQMTFFVAHSAIDKEHAEEVERMLKSQCKTEQDWADVAQVAEVTLQLTGNLLEDVYWEYQQVISGASKRFPAIHPL